MTPASTILFPLIFRFEVDLFHIVITSSFLATLFRPSARLFFLAPLLVA
jgi:hypothetical protein